MAVERATPETYWPWLVTPVGQVELVVPVAADPDGVAEPPPVVVVVEGTVEEVVESTVVDVVVVVDEDVESAGLVEPDDPSVEELDTAVSPEVPEGMGIPMS